MQVVLIDDASAAIDQLKNLISGRNPSRYCFSFIGSTYSQSSFRERVGQLRDLAASCFGENKGLLVVTCQRSLRPVQDSVKRKRVCQSGQAVSLWTKELEEGLAAAVKEVNLALMSVTIV